jgi:hypothetical protein
MAPRLGADADDVVLENGYAFLELACRSGQIAIRHFNQAKPLSQLAVGRIDGRCRPILRFGLLELFLGVRQVTQLDHRRPAPGLDRQRLFESLA